MSDRSSRYGRDLDVSVMSLTGGREGGSFIVTTLQLLHLPFPLSKYMHSRLFKQLPFLLDPPSLAHSPDIASTFYHANFNPMTCFVLRCQA